MGKKALRPYLAVATLGASEAVNMVSGGKLFSSGGGSSGSAALPDPVATATDPTVRTEDPNVQAEAQAVRRRLRAKAGRMGTLLALDNTTQSANGLKTKLGE